MPNSFRNCPHPQGVHQIASTTKTRGKCAIHNSLSSLPSSGAFTGAFLALPGRPTVSTVHQSHSRRACRPAGTFAGRFGVISARPAERRDGKDWPTKKNAKVKDVFLSTLQNSPGWKKNQVAKCSKNTLVFFLHCKRSFSLKDAFQNNDPPPPQWC